MTRKWVMTKKGNSTYVPVKYKMGKEFQGVEKRTVTVELVEVEQEENADLFAFEDFITGELDFIFPSLYQVKMCSPDGFKSDIKENTGRIVYLQEKGCNDGN